MIGYIIDFLLNGKYPTNYVYYGQVDGAPSEAKIIIVPSGFFSDEKEFFKDSVVNRKELPLLNNEEKTPIIFGEARIEKITGEKIVLYADIVASAFFLLSRYEEIIYRNRRDIYGRFLAKYSELTKFSIFERAVVDEYSEYLIALIDKLLGKQTDRTHGFSKIYLTHDVDVPFYYHNWISVFKQAVKNILPGYKKDFHLLHNCLHWRDDPFYTFPKLFEYDKAPVNAEVIYFLIVAKATKKNVYCDINSSKYQGMLKELINSGATLGLHVSHEAGIEPDLLNNEVTKFKNLTNSNKVAKLYSRHHFLRWREPEHAIQMEKAGITDDFTLSFADKVGFRVGTCRSYRFIVNKKVTNLVIHPLEIMECTLCEERYMNLPYEEALKECKSLIKTVYKHNGEFNVLFHNTALASSKYDELYRMLLKHLATL